MSSLLNVRRCSCRRFTSREQFQGVLKHVCLLCKVYTRQSGHPTTQIGLERHGPRVLDSLWDNARSLDDSMVRSPTPLDFDGDHGVKKKGLNGVVY